MSEPRLYEAWQSADGETWNYCGRTTDRDKAEQFAEARRMLRDVSMQVRDQATGEVLYEIEA